MRFKILLTLFFGCLLWVCSGSAQQSTNGASKQDAPQINTNPPANTPPIGDTGKPLATPTPAPSPNPIPIALPQDTASLNAKEILAANNQVVSQVASMYQNLGLFITIIITLVGGVATFMGYLARKNVHELVAEWTKKLEKIESEMNNTQKRLRLATDESENAARAAAKDAQNIKDSQAILDKALSDVEGLRHRVISLETKLHVSGGMPPAPIEEEPQDNPENLQAEVVTPEESAEVKAILDKMGAEPEGGTRS